ncbi:MAG: hypothetical protein WAM14_07690 [Candidatus Nitrosopolaris sp.]
MSQTLVKLTNRLTPNQKNFVAEIVGTFIVVVFATGSVVIDSKMHGVLGIPFIAFAPFGGYRLCCLSKHQDLRNQLSFLEYFETH